MTDNWKTDGNCQKCRRAKYCGKICSAHRRSLENGIWETIKRDTGIKTLEDYLMKRNELEYIKRRCNL